MYKNTGQHTVKLVRSFKSVVISSNFVVNGGNEVQYIMGHSTHVIKTVYLYIHIEMHSEID